MAEEPDPIDRAVGARVRLRRRALKISQMSLASALGVSFQQVQKYERGANRVSASSLVRMATALECTVAHLVGEGEGDQASFAGDLLPSDALELIEVFSRISDPRARRAIIDLATSLGEKTCPSD